MALLEILEYPHPGLKLVAEPVTTFDASLQKIVQDMIETMIASDGIGLAATQVNIHKRILVAELSVSGSAPVCLINPNIINAEGSATFEEGCLSFPGIYAKVTRSSVLRVEFCDLNGVLHNIDIEGLDAICIQHEIDHLNGITFFDHLSSLKQKMILKKLSKTRDRVS